MTLETTAPTSPAAPTQDLKAQRRRTPPLISSTAVCVVLGLALVKGLSPFSEPDVWWHLRMGELIASTRSVTFWDASAAFADRPYVATQWLPELIASWASSLWDGAVLWFRASAIVALTAAVYVLSRRYAARLPAAVIAGLVLVGAGGGLNPRPQLLSFIFFTFTLHA